jgi:hypothetical protein
MSRIRNERGIVFRCLASGTNEALSCALKDTSALLAWDALRVALIFVRDQNKTGKYKKYIFEINNKTG